MCRPTVAQCTTEHLHGFKGTHFACRCCTQPVRFPYTSQLFHHGHDSLSASVPHRVYTCKVHHSLETSRHIVLESTQASHRRSLQILSSTEDSQHGGSHCRLPSSVPVVSQQPQQSEEQVDNVLHPCQIVSFVARSRSKQHKHIRTV